MLVLPAGAESTREKMMKRNRVIGIALATFTVITGSVLAPTGVQATVSYFSTTKIVQATVYLDARKLALEESYLASVSVVCPTGYKVTGGGADMTAATTQGYLTRLYNHQVTDSAPRNNGWFADGWTSSGYANLNVYAICVK